MKLSQNRLDQVIKRRSDDGLRAQEDAMTTTENTTTGTRAVLGGVFGALGITPLGITPAGITPASVTPARGKTRAFAPGYQPSR